MFCSLSTQQSVLCGGDTQELHVTKKETGAWKGEELPKKGDRRTLIACLYFSTISPSSFIIPYLFIFDIHQNTLVCGAWMF